MKLAKNPGTRLLTLDAGNNQVNPSIRHGTYNFVRAVTSDGTHVYTTKGDGNVKKFTRDLVFVKQISIAGAQTLNGITYGAGHFWTWDQGARKIRKHDPDDFSELSAISWSGIGLGMTYSANFPTNDPSPALYINSRGTLYRFPSC